jgi:hypothetical protein
MGGASAVAAGLAAAAGSAGDAARLLLEPQLLGTAAACTVEWVALEGVGH